MAPIHNAARLIPIAEKPPVFSGINFKRWSQKMSFYITTMGLASFLREERPPAPTENETDVQVRTNYDIWIHSDYVCRNILINGLDDGLFNVFNIKEPCKEIWDALELKYHVNPASTKKFVVTRLTEFHMVDTRPMMPQVLGVCPRMPLRGC
ncbi:hypothetical protein OROHE_003675 [Orobanche hederae]